jgi:VIT1/CCC1 family predicted Fe2+/Mn2+ transporter
MNPSIRTGLFFGLTSGVITTLGLLVGLQAGTQSQQAVIGGILIIAVADAMSDALGIHLSEEASEHSNPADTWAATLTTFVAKFITSLSFVLPVIFLPAQQAVMASVIWGGLLLTVLSVALAHLQTSKAWPIIFEHLGIATVVVLASYFIGHWIAQIFS